jgi:hypothetical protein
MSAELPALVPDAEPENPLVAPAPQVLELLERAQIDTQISTAKRYPRPELDKIQKRMLTFATIDQETAAACFYSLKRFDARTQETKLIQGPSVRLAEIAVVSYENIWAGARITDNDGRKITSQGICWDLERNVRMFAEDIRRITHKDGRPYSEDMQIIAAKAANAIARRNAVFQVIPLALITPVYEEAKRVAVGGAATLQQRRDKVFKRFSSMGVDIESILRVLGKEAVESVDVEDLAFLIGLGTAIRDQEITIEEAFRPAGEGSDGGEGESAPTRGKLRDRLLARRAEKRAAAAAEKAPEAERSPEPGEEKQP